MSVAYSNRGVAYFDLRDYDHAISDFNDAIRLNPNDTLAIHSLKNATDAKAVIRAG